MLDSQGSRLENAVLAGQTIHQVLESTAEPAYSVDEAGRISGWNRSAQLLLGYLKDEVLDQPCHKVLRGVDVFGNRYCESECPLLLMARQRLPIRQFQMRVYHRDRTPLPVLCFAFRIPVGGLDAFSLLHLLRSADQPLPRSVKRGGNDTPRLTPRELDVLRLLANGQTTNGIATQIYVSPATVRKHIQNLFKKLDVHTRLGAVSAAFEKGIL